MSLSRPSPVSVERPQFTRQRSRAIGAEDDNDEHGWDLSYTREDARDKADSTHSTMGLVSALLAGFQLQALVEVNTCADDDTTCTGAEAGFVIASTLCVCLSTIVVFETSVEYMLVMRELHHGHQSAWKLIKLFTPYRRVAEYCFAFDLPVFILSCAMMVHVRFATLTQSTTIATVAEVLLACTLALLLGMMMLMQRVKHVHGEGKKKEREKKRQREEQRKAAAALMAQPGGAEGSSLRAASKKRRSLGVFAGALGQSMGRKQMGRLISVLPGNNSNRSSMRDSDDEVTSSPSPSPEPQGTKAARGNRKGVGFSDQISDDGGVQLSERAQGGSECAPSRPDLVPVRRDSQVERLLAAHDAASHSLDSELGSMRESTREEDSGGSNSQAV